jgi:OmpA family
LFVSEGVNYAQQIAANEVESISRSYTAGVHYVPKEPPKPAPNKTMKLFHETTEFGVNERVPKPDQLALLKGWWIGSFGTRPLPDEGVRQAVRLGQSEVSVVGHASRTGSREYNLVLAKDRADHVADFLRTDPDMMRSAAHLNVSSSGSDDATTKEEAQT